MVLRLVLRFPSYLLGKTTQRRYERVVNCNKNVREVRKFRVSERPKTQSLELDVAYADRQRTPYSNEGLRSYLSPLLNP